MKLRVSAAAIIIALAAFPCLAQEDLVFEDFEDVSGWDGFELSTEHSHSGDTSAYWPDMVQYQNINNTDIPHDWSDWDAFTFWVYNETELPATIRCIIFSQNDETEGPDYWSVSFGLDFTGWKMFGRELVETGGARTPVGLHKIDSITFTSKWGNTPNPDAKIYIDELTLTNRFNQEGPLLADREFFNLLREDIPELEATRAAADSGNYDTAGEELLHYFRSRTEPVWHFDWRDWDNSRKLDYSTHAAERACEHMFSAHGVEMHLGDDIDWTSNPWDRTDPDYARTWTAHLNRMHMWGTLGQAYWATGDEKYAREFVDQMTDFIEDQPAPVFGSPSQFPCWLTIQQGIRMAGSWMDAFHYFLGSPSMTPEAFTMFLKSFVEHARLLTRMAVENPQHGGNWVTMEMNGLAHVAIMFPEFKESAHWKDVAYSRLLEELDRQVYPDGAQKELSTGYHQVARRNFLGALEPARMNDVPIPDGYMDRLKKMYWYNLRCMKPNGQLPPLNDAGNTRVRDSLQEAYDIWGDPGFLWGATLGGDGEPVDFTSWFFPWAGQCVMRSGWERSDVYLMFEIGPYGIGHQHEDKLGLTLYAYGRDLLTEAGTYKYDHSKWRRYVLTSPSHNTVLVDGLSQHRYRQRKLYENDEPLTENWTHTETFDWAFGRYDAGYGERGSSADQLLQVEHERTVIFVRPDYFVVIDRLLGDGQPHTYSNLFHFDAPEAILDPDTLVATSAEPRHANITLVPLDTRGLSARIVKGQEDPVQGWIPRQERKIPTVIYDKTSADDTLFVTLLVPHPGENAPGMEAELVTANDEMLAMSVQSAEGMDRILYSFDETRQMEAGGVRATGKLAVVREPVEGDMRIGILDGERIAIDRATPFVGQ